MKNVLAIVTASVMTMTVLCTPITYAEKDGGEYTVLPGASSSKITEPVSAGNYEFALPGLPGENVTPDDDIAASGTVSSVINVSINMIPCMKVIDSSAVLELYSSDGIKLAEGEEWVGGITENIEYSFTVPEYHAGQRFTLRLRSGLTYLKYYDGTYASGDNIILETYGYANEAGEPAVANSFALDGCPIYEHAIVMYVKGDIQNLSSDARLINGVAMAPVKPIAEALGLRVRYDKAYNSVVCEIGDSQAIFNIGTAYATIIGNDMYMPEACVEIDGPVFVPVRVLAEAFGSPVEALDFVDHIDVCLGESPMVKEFLSRYPVNSWNISSRTPYMVWVDKSNYRVHIYLGSKNNWVEQKSFPCAIGAPGTPTITGSYEYQYRVSRWEYDGYYVGPCLVFHGGYALHSTLLRYDGTPYDNRVGVKISHGCIRLHKSDIDWIASYLPVGSRIYVTE